MQYYAFMTLEPTEITIRERNYLELMDLALQLLRFHWWGLLVTLAVGSIPVALVNFWVISAIVNYGAIRDSPNAYSWLLILLMLWEAPLGTAFMTLYLGQITFTRVVDWNRLCQDYIGSLLQLLWFQGILRSLTASLLLVGLIIPHLAWPYLSEVILLERNYFFSYKGRQITTWRRSRNLHRHFSGDLFARWLGTMVTGWVLVTAILLGIQTTAFGFFGIWLTSLTIVQWYVPLAGWLVIGFFTVVRFLAYLDLRIRREGWEVELVMRAEAARLARVAV
jgi:hypothetical protein